MDRTFIQSRIPHRPPFLLLDKVIDPSDTQIKAEKHIPEDWEVFKGHYQHYPIVPGGLLCEAVFQAGAVLISNAMSTQGVTIPVLTRILSAKFKREVCPGDILVIQAQITEKLGPAWLLKGSIRVEGKVAVQVEFACAEKEA